LPIFFSVPLGEDLFPDSGDDGDHGDIAILSIRAYPRESTVSPGCSDDARMAVIHEKAPASQSVTKH
jgi:hypothetical protein